MTDPRCIYLDNNATTQPDAAVVEAMTQTNLSVWGNPSSVHRLGQLARQRVELARQSVATLIGAKPRHLVFTSGGTEANNLALRGLLGGTGERGLLLTTGVEHAAVREPAEALAAEGVAVRFLSTDGHGQLHPDALGEALREAGASAEVVLVSVQWANNETGLIQPVAALADVVRAGRAQASDPRRRVLLHVDATQAVGKIPVDFAEVGADLLTLAGHKFHGPKGVGALCVKAGVRPRTMVRGGPQERGLRGGTENTPGIIGLGVAAELARAFVHDTDRIAVLRRLRDRLERGLLDACPDARVNAPDDDDHTRLWNTTNIGFPGLEAEAILLGLSERGVCASAGAACSSGSLEPSAVLRAMGVPEAYAHGSIRFSLSRFTTADDIDAALPHVVEVVKRLRRTLPMGNATLAR